MPERKRKSYTAEFRKKAVDLTLTSDHPTSYVAKLLKVNSTTLANWVARYSKKQQPKAKKVVRRRSPKEELSAKDQEQNASFTEKLFEQLGIPAAEVSDEVPSSNEDSKPDEERSIFSGDPPTDLNQQSHRVQHDKPDDEPESILSDVQSQLPQELERLRKENKRLLQERNTFRETIILLARTYSSS